MRQGIIAAISTPPGKGGVAIIRLSGDGAVQLIDGMFRPKGGKLFSSYPQRYQVYGELYDGEVLLDDCMATRFERERSYTGEETVELSIHGGILLGQRVLTALFGQGVIPAAPGEFTRTAFLNGRLSLTEVEAIGDLLEAKSEEQLNLSSSRSRERLKATIEDIRERLVRTLSSIYARIDYPEEDLGDMTDSEVIESLKDARERLMKLISTYRTGKAINEGITTSLVGKTNVGKSTLYNIIAGEDVAIVTDVEGTTRDLIERTIPLGRILLRISDTAGLRDKSLVDIVERIGIERTRESVLRSELVLALFDLSRPYSAEDDEVIALCQEARGAKVAVLTKSDIEPSLFDESHLSGRFDAVIKVSEKEPDAAISDISSLLDRLFTDEKISTSSDAIVASARQSAALTRAVSFVDSAIEALTLGIPQDAASSDIELALSAIGECDGRVVTDEVTGDIFRRFCVGK